MSVVNKICTVTAILLLCTGCDFNKQNPALAADIRQTTVSTLSVTSTQKPEEPNIAQPQLYGIVPSSISVSDKFTDVIEINGELGGFFVLTFDFGSKFSIAEKYIFTNNSGFLSVSATVTLADFETPDEVCEYFSDAIDKQSFVKKTDKSYMLALEDSVLLPNVTGLSLDEAYLLASSLEVTASDIKANTVNQTNTKHPESEPIILDYSDSTLIMDKYTMHVGLGEIRQLVIAECPEEYADKLLFISDNPSAATVDSAGNVRGIKNGSATITVTVDGASGYASVMVYVY